MRSLHRPTRVVSLILAIGLGASSCGGETQPAAGANEAAASAEGTGATGAQNDELPDVAATDGWVIEIGDGHVVADPATTICLPIPGGTFSVSGGGDNGFGGEFFFSLGNSSGDEFRYEVGGIRTVELGPDTEGTITIEHDAVTARVVATGEIQNGTPFVVSGMC